MKIDLLWVLVALVVVYYYARQETLEDVQRTQQIFNRAMEAASPVVVSGDVNPLLFAKPDSQTGLVPKAMNPFLY